MKALLLHRSLQEIMKQKGTVHSGRTEVPLLFVVYFNYVCLRQFFVSYVHCGYNGLG